jgi:hypothetical protein
MDLHEEGDEAGAEDHQDEQVSSVSLQKEVKDLSVQLNQVLDTVEKLTKQTSAPGLLQEAIYYYTPKYVCIIYSRNSKSGTTTESLSIFEEHRSCQN